MKASLPTACLAALAFVVPAVLAQSARPAPAPEPFEREYSYMLSAGEARSAIEQGQTTMVVGYVSGIMDALMRERDFCVPAGVSTGTIASNAYKVLGQQPRESQAPAADVVAVYLHNDYPCRK